MGYEQGLSGLSAASQNLNVIGNNVANSETVGFKQSTVDFADVYAGTQAGSTSTQVGLGVTVAAVAQDFTQGSITTTGNPLDMAINGQGFFQVSDNGTTQYTRDGQFSLSQSGNIVTATGAEVLGYPASANGSVSTSGSPVPLTIPTGAIAAKTTSTIDAALNLDSSTTPITTAFDAGNSATYAFSSSLDIYDSLGNSHTLATYYVPTGENAAGQNVWNVYASNDGTMVGGSPATPVGQLTFNTDGTIDTTASTFPASMSIPVATGATTPMTVSLDLTGTTQYGATSAVNAQTQNGYTSGTLSNYAISDTGVITGNYSNGQSQNLGTVALANFPAPTQLTNLGNNVWVQSATSGSPLVGVAGSGTLGTIQSGAVEDSNTDLTTDLVDLITAQRDYQANAQTIKTEDTLMQTLVTLE